MGQRTRGDLVQRMVQAVHMVLGIAVVTQEDAMGVVIRPAYAASVPRRQGSPASPAMCIPSANR